jgi:hypothetical protein
MNPNRAAVSLPRAAAPAGDLLLAEILAGLLSRPKYLYPKFFYDERGSLLFDRICELPEYYLTRTETAILAERGPTFIRALGPGLRRSSRAGSQAPRRASCSMPCKPRRATCVSTFRAPT